MGSGSRGRLPAGKKRVSQVPPTFGCPPSGRGGKAIDTSNEPSLKDNSSHLDTGKSKVVTLSKAEVDYLNCSRDELRGRILRYTVRTIEVPREVLHYECSLSNFHLGAYPSYLQLIPPDKARHALSNKHPSFLLREKLGYIYAIYDRS